MCGGHSVTNQCGKELGFAQWKYAQTNEKKTKETVCVTVGDDFEPKFEPLTGTFLKSYFATHKYQFTKADTEKFMGALPNKTNNGQAKTDIVGVKFAW